MWVHCCHLQTHQKRAPDPCCRWLWATMWLLGFELRTSVRAVNALSHWAISPALIFKFLNYICLEREREREREREKERERERELKVPLLQMSRTTFRSQFSPCDARAWYLYPLDLLTDPGSAFETGLSHPRAAINSLCSPGWPWTLFWSCLHSLPGCSG